MERAAPSWTWGVLGGLVVLVPLLALGELSASYDIISEAGRLEAVAAEAAAVLDPALHERVQAPEDASDPAFLELRQRLLEVEERHALSSPMYTLRLSLIHI